MSTVDRVRARAFPYGFAPTVHLAHVVIDEIVSVANLFGCLTCQPWVDRRQLLVLAAAPIQKLRFKLRDLLGGALEPVAHLVRGHRERVATPGNPRWVLVGAQLRNELGCHGLHPVSRTAPHRALFAVSVCVAVGLPLAPARW